MNKRIYLTLSTCLFVSGMLVSCSQQEQKSDPKERTVVSEKTPTTKSVEKQESPEVAASTETDKVLPPPPPPQKIRFIEPRIVEDIGPDESYALIDREGPMNVGMVDGPYHDGSGDYEEVRSQDEVLYFSDPMPEFPGGQAKLMDYLKSNIKYPVEAREMGIEGKVYIGYVVKTDGSISDVKVRRGVHQTLDREAIRVIKSMPNWIPGKQDGKPVNVQMTIPVKFTLTQ